MAAVAQIIIEVDDKGAIASIRGLDAEMKKLDPALQKIGQRGNVVLTQLRRDQERARAAAQLLGNTLGIQLPRELEKFLAQSKTVAPVLASAFNVAIIGGFGFAIGNLVAHTLPQFLDFIRGITDYTRKQEEAHKRAGIAATAQFKEELIGQARLNKTLREIIDLEAQRAHLIEQTTKSTLGLALSVAFLSDTEKKLLELEEQKEAVEKRLDELKEARLLRGPSRRRCEARPGKTDCARREDRSAATRNQPAVRSGGNPRGARASPADRGPSYGSRAAN